MSKKVRKAVFPVGGLGTRFLPATKAMPKEMLPVVDKPLIQYAVEEAKAAGIEEFIFVTGRGKTAIENHFDHDFELQQTLSARGKKDMLEEVLSPVMEPGQICYVRQQDPLGLGHAVWCARHMIGDEPFAILLADDLIKSKTACLKQMVDAQAYYGGNVVAVMEVPKQHVNRYGVVDPGRAEGNVTQVRGLVEKPPVEKAPSNLAVIGRYILQPDVFEHLEAKERGSGGEIQLTDAMAKMIGDMPFHGLTFEGKRFDCGDKVGFLGANIAFALDREDMRAGVQDLIKGLN